MISKYRPLICHPACCAFVSVAIWVFLSGCGHQPVADNAPVFLLDLVDRGEVLLDAQLSSTSTSNLSTMMTLDADTRRALGTPLRSRLEFEVALPENPVFRFSLGGSAFGAEILPDPIDFRVRVESEGESDVAFSETMRRVQANRWLDREIDFSRWAGSAVRLVLETERGRRANGPSSSAPMLPLWANPVVASTTARFARPNIVLISIDCLRPDHLSAYGYERKTSPNIDALAEEGVLFENVIATSSWTFPTHMSMLTGAPPSIHGATRWQKLDPGVAFLPEVLTEAGYRADGLVTVAYLSQHFGFDRGFHSYRFRSDLGATKVVDESIRLVRRAVGQNHFLFMHMLDVHWPYAPPEAYRAKFAERPTDISQLLRMVGEDKAPKSQETIDQVVDLYDGEIAYVDEELGRFFDELKRLGLYENTLIVFTGDHGEAFYEHDFWKHTHTLYNEMVRVPLIVKWPGESLTGRVTTMVSQTDVFATVLGAASLESPGAWSRNLRDALERVSAPGSRTMVSEVLWDERPGIREATMKVALRTDHHTYIATLDGDEVAELSINGIRKEELYDLKTDPEERTNLAATSDVELRAFREKLRGYFQEAKRLRASRKGERVVLDEEVLEQLRTLGYVEG